MTPLTAEQTVDRAKAVLQSGAAAGLPELLKLIETLSTDIYKVNLDELSELIEKDTTVLAKVITVANTLSHNPGISPVATITQAIHHVGFHRIRTLAVSLMLIENTGAARNPPEQREAAAQALCAGLFAQSIAEQLGTIEPEVAFAAGTLRHFGDITLPAVSIDHTRAALKRQKTMPRDIAFRGMFGLTPIELSRRLLAAARLPEEVSRALRDCEPRSLGGTASVFETRLLAASDLGSRLALHALDPAINSEAFFIRGRQTARLFNRLVPSGADFVEPALIKSGERMQNFLNCSGVTSLPTQSLRRLRMHACHLSGEEEAPTVDGAAAPPPTENAPPAVETATSAEAVPPALPPAPEAWDEALEKSDAFANRSVVPVDPPPSVTLALARDAAQAEECWLFQRPEGGEGFSLTISTGPTPVNTPTAPNIRPDERSVFGVCIAKNEVVVLHNAGDKSIARYLPAWWQQAHRAPLAFALVPIRSGNGVAGIALVGWHNPRRVTLTGGQVGLVQQICADVILRSRSGATGLAA